MNKTDKSRERRIEKTRKDTLVALVIIILVILALVLVGKSVFFCGDNENSELSESEMKVNNNGDANNLPPSSDTNENSESSESNEAEKEEDKKKKEELEAQRKEEYGEFYVPLPEEEIQIEHIDAKGLYLNHNNVHLDFDEQNIENYEKYVNYVLGQAESYPDGAENANVLEQMLAICNATEINSIVIDIKTDDGYLTWQSDIEIVNELDKDADSASFNYEKLISYMKENDIRPIARIVTFKDSFLPRSAPEHGMKMADGSNFVDGSGAAWVDQTDKFVWDYVIAISREAALRGFEEIHFDYVRYPEATSEHTQIGEDGQPVERDEVIKEFLSYANNELEDYNVEVGAAVFGLITSTWEDEPEDIGQTWLKISGVTDSISPMIYPSHYSTGWYGYEIPDFEPYGVFKGAMTDAYEKNSAVESPAEIRPWIQGFTADYLDVFAEYDGKMIAEQVRAIYEYGIDEYIIWNALNEYDPEIFKYTQSYEPRGPIEFSDFEEYSFEDMLAEQNDGVYTVVDIHDRSPYEVVRMFLDNIGYDNPGRLFLISSRASREKTFDEFLSNDVINMTFNSYEVSGIQEDGESYLFDIILYTDIGTQNIQMRVVLEDSIFKVSEIIEGESTETEAIKDTEYIEDIEDTEEYEDEESTELS